jgi:drug/metabolite transporter (DMT)-like permease
MNPAYLVAMLGSVLFGAADLAGGISAKRAPAPVITCFSGYAALLVLFLGVPFVHGTPTGADLAWGAVAGTCGMLGATLIYHSLALGPVSVASPVFCVIGLSTPVLAGVFYGERPSPLAWSGVALAAASLPPLAWSGANATAEERAHLRRTLMVAIAAGLVVGGFLIAVHRIGAHAGLLPLIVARTVAIAGLTAGLFVMRIPLVPPPAARGSALAAGALDSSANVCFWLASQQAPLALVAALVSLSPATTVVLGRLLLKEPWTGAQKLGLLMALVAGVLISLG